jgi:hypothetical protein
MNDDTFKNLVTVAKNISISDPFLEEYLKVFRTLKQEVKNIEIKKLCKEAKWYFKDIIGNDGITYTTFSNLENKNI